MQWAAIATLLIQYGLPFVEKLIEKWTNNNPVTMDEWNSLKALAQNTALSQMKAALSRAGIPETDPRAVELLKAAAAV